MWAQNKNESNSSFTETETPFIQYANDNHHQQIDLISLKSTASEKPFSIVLYSWMIMGTMCARQINKFQQNFFSIFALIYGQTFTVAGMPKREVIKAGRVKKTRGKSKFWSFELHLCGDLGLKRAKHF